MMCVGCICCQMCYGKVVDVVVCQCVWCIGLCGCDLILDLGCGVDMFGKVDSFGWVGIGYGD